MTDAPQKGVIPLLTAQAVALGVTCALLVVPANSIFLNAYGSKWLPATYIAIAVLGSGASALIARAARRTRLVRVATVSLSALAVLYAASWLILVAGGLWMSAFLLVLFPIALQVGFVFIGGQAGRLLDVRQMKERFPRVIGGFVVGFLLGGLLGIPLLVLLGSTEQLLLGTTAAQIVFLGLLIVTERRFPEVKAGIVAGSAEVARPSARALFASRLVLLLLTYQFLSAMGSWLLDFLLFNRAQAEYSGDDLTRFLSGYTALLNLTAIVFLALFAGPLLRRYGLRVGLTLNPAVVVGLLAIMAVTVAGQGVAAYNVFVLAAVARLADIVLTDGTTRTSVNATFQMVPVADRLAVQAFVEGVGVPVAIGVTGAVLLLINLGGLGAGAVIVFGVLVSVVWTVSGAAMYRSYRRALANEMRREPVLATSVAIDQDDAALQALLRSEDAREVRLGLDLLPHNVSLTSGTDIREHPDPGVRMLTLGRFAASGDATAAKEVAELVAELAHSPDPIDRRAAALGLVWANNDRNFSILLGLLNDGETSVRSAALDAVTPEDAVEEAVIRTVVAAAGDPHTRRCATAALRRLGEPAIPFVAAAIASDGGHRRASLVRAAAALAADHGLPVIKPALDDPDRVVVLTALEAFDAAGGHYVPLSDALDGLFEDAAGHAALALAARCEFAVHDGSLTRALDDEVDLARRLMIAILALRHGAGVHDAVRVIERTDGQRRALGVEALDVLISREEAASTLPLIRRDLTPDEMTAALWRSQLPVRRREDWLADMADDPDSVWRSSWLARCARQSDTA